MRSIWKTAMTVVALSAASWNVQAVYIPNGKTIPQYWGSYVRGSRLYKCRQAPRMNSSGIHHVPDAQKNSVKPTKKGRISPRKGQSGVARISLAPASVVIATAPMLIQYGGVSVSRVISRNVKR